MDYLFGDIEDLIRKTVQAVRQSAKGVSKQLEHYGEQLKSTVEFQKRSFALKAQSLESNQAIERFVRLHQLALVFMMNSIFNEMTADNQTTRMFLDGSIYREIERFLIFLASQYAGYFDLNAQLPHGSALELFTDVKNSVTNISNGLINRQVELNLFNLCIELPTMLLTESNIVTFAVSLNVQDFLRRIEHFIRSTAKGSDLDREIRKAFVEHDLNTTTVYEYLIEHMQSTLLNMDNESDRIQYLHLQIKLIKQATSYTSPRKDYNETSLAYRLLEWIGDEVQYITKALPSLSTNSTTNAENFKDFKIPINMSVSQFAFLIKTFVETGIIQNTNTSELLRFFANYVSSKKSGTISPESLRIKYYNVEGTTKDAVRSILNTSIGYINSN